MDEISIRKTIIDLLAGGHAHMTLEDAVKDFPQDAYNTIFPNGTYSSWHLLEHIRRTQKDILDFMIDPQYTEMEWPRDYWPEKSKKATEKEWEKTLDLYFADLKDIKNLAMDTSINLSAKISNGDGQTYIREFLLVADHTAYHLGEFAIMRQVQNTWKK